jgi:hypothetical protein
MNPDDLLLQLLKEWEATPEGPERLKAFRCAIEALDAEFQVKEDEPGVVYAWTANRVFVWREGEGWTESRQL